MQYFDIKKSLPVFCSLLITACSGGGGGGSNNSNHQAHPVNQVPAPVLHVAAKPQQHVEQEVIEKKPPVPVTRTASQSSFYSAKAPSQVSHDKRSVHWKGESVSEKEHLDFSYSKDAVFTRHLVTNPNAVYSTDPNLISKDIKYITLTTTGYNQDNKSGPNYELNLLDENIYYGYYRDSQDMNHVENIYVYGFKKDAENQDNLQFLTANYQGEFLFSTATNPNVPVLGKAVLNYKEGKAKGEILERDSNYKLFDIYVNERPNQAILNPVAERLPTSDLIMNTRKNSPDRVTIDLHFIKGQDNQENKYIVGQGGNEKYWGVLGLEKKETKAEK
ncbi:hypothetical protein ACFGZG_10285 [Pasteurella multocida]|uniref:Outer membrane lipoprotein PM1514 n=1 Tax=Pasteurella multocida (strain Pm70) TaxID=272843 RepID=Y1514_PASMU|nr:hypothetical protein [Pasteurella multocida]Q9CKU2.1 RecName: Full=Outer membrane lipoprotein PM1514; Flags: Precursor [Pasteurella multocida subsp. multocida str. Pm70]AAK03598.1 unknown [Pasteurella multocida subsp. multocida str. Pm70]APW56251.1 putative transmembrane protein [Pasteurella multocida subsp. multocida str. HN07]AUL54044.1 hypothetical protein ATO47_08030 [Pasteurella multocida]AWB55514.1 hypothetical protein pm9n_07965 [Pasteurella multocida]EPE73859.1 hypothetical protein